MSKKAENKVKYSKETYMYWYESMVLQRKFEERAGQLYGQQKIRGFCHLYIGQEACSSGAASALREGDKYIYAYRDWETDRKSTRLNSSHLKLSRMPSSA